MTYYIGADVGTSSVKLLALNEQGDVCAKCEKTYALASPNPGWLEIEPEIWWKATMQGLQELLIGLDRAAVRAIGFTGQMHTTVFIDQNGHSIRPAISWNDTRTVALIDWLKQRTAESPELGHIHNILSTGSPAANLLWLKQNEPASFDRLHTMLIGPDYLTYRFSGRYGTDYCEASTSSMFDIHRHEWSTKMCEIVGVSKAVLPTVRGAGERVGNLLPEIAEQLGLSADVQMIAGTGDNPATYLSSGQLASGEPMISLGTSGVLIFSRADAKGRDKGKPILFSMDGQTFKMIVQGAVQSSGGSFRWWAKDILQSRHFDDVSDQVDCDSPVKPQLLFYPHLVGDKTVHADPYLRGAFIGIGTDATQAETTRAILEGIGFAFRQLMEKMHSDRALHTIKVTGGMSRMPSFMQILADILDVCVEVSDEIGAAQGIALLAAYSCGVEDAFDRHGSQQKQMDTYHPRSKFVAAYQEKYAIYSRIYHALKQIYLE